MDRRLRALALAHRGVLSAADAAVCDVSPSTVERLVRSNALVRVRRDALVLGEMWTRASPEERHRLTTRAVLHARPPGDAASHHAAVLLAGVDTFGVDLGVVDIAAAVNRVRLRAGVRTHPRPPGPALAIDGCRVVDLPLALCQVAAWSGQVAGVCSMDDAVHDRRCTVEDLSAALTRLPGREQDAAERAISLVDPEAESVGESRLRLVLHDLGLRFISQHPVRTSRGRLLGRLDFLVEGVVALEFDGQVKYEGVVGGAALAAEKQRERGIWDEGYEVERVVWRELDVPLELRRRIALAKARAIGRDLARPDADDIGLAPI